jgi:predicted dehydrogenase
MQALRETEATVAHICDIVPEVASPYQDQFGCRYTDDASVLLRDPDVTAVAILTSTQSHRDLCIAALEAGKDVICEKTLGINEAESYEIALKAKETGKLFYVGYMKRFFPAVAKLTALLPTIGRVFSATVRANQGWGNFYESDSLGSFDFVLGRYGGAAMKCAGSHMIDMTLALFGLPDRVSASVDYVENTEFDRKASALFCYPDGMVVNFETATHPLTRIGYEANSWEEWIQVTGTEGRLELHTVQWDRPLANPLKLVHYDNESETTSVYHFQPADPFVHEIEAVSAGFASRRQGRPDAIDGYNVDLMIESMETASREGRAVTVRPRITR